MPPRTENTSPQPSLGEYLASIRDDRGLTLRDVEEATTKQISNAYLSQIEKGKIQKPSPNILYSLAEIYGISFENLMMMAGHMTPLKDRVDNERHGRIATFSEHNLTAEEESEMLEFLQFIRFRDRSGAKT